MGLEGKFHPMGSGRRDIRGEELYCIYLGEVLCKGADVEKWSWSLWVRLGTTVRQIVHT